MEERVLLVMQLGASGLPPNRVTGVYCLPRQTLELSPLGPGFRLGVRPPQLARKMFRVSTGTMPMMGFTVLPPRFLFNMVAELVLVSDRTKLLV